MPKLEILSTTAVTAKGGVLLRVKHDSSATKTEMIFAIFLPSSFQQMAPHSKKAIYWLSGLTCTDANFCQKAGGNAFGKADEEGICMVMPDTSPRGDSIPSDDAYDLGTGAGFYINATNAPWDVNYRMEEYITTELPALVEAEWGVGAHGLRSLAGHSMGGHGALTLALKGEPGSWCSVSAFAPICHPSKPSPWGEKAFKAYLGSVEAGKDYDATELIQKPGKAEMFDDILIDEGTADEFGQGGQLLLEDFEEAAKKVGQKLTVRRQQGFDHSYHFIATFIADHVVFHAKKLRKTEGALAAKIAKQTFDAMAAAGTAGKPIECKAMVARGPKQPLTLETITVDTPREGEVRVKVIANALCHTDIYTLDGHDPEGLFPCILGHEAGCVVESVGAGVTSVKPGDKVVPCYTPQCAEAQCVFCMSPKTNLCPKIRGTQGAGFMPDGTSRFKDKDGNPIYHFMGCSTMAEYTVLAEISCAKIAPEAPLEKVCLFGCGVATGLGAVWNTCKVEPDSSVAVFGLGAVGLSVIQGAKMAGASRIIAVDVNPKKFVAAIALGATDCINPNEVEGPIQTHIAGTVTKWGVDYTFDCTGNVQVMRAALESSHRGWGTSCVIGVAASGHEIATRPFQLVTGRVWKGTAFGGWKSRKDVPHLVDRYLAGTLPIDHYITDVLQGIEKTNDAITALHSGDCLRAVVQY